MAAEARTQGEDGVHTPVERPQQDPQPCAHLGLEYPDAPQPAVLVTAAPADYHPASWLCQCTGDPGALGKLYVRPGALSEHRCSCSVGSCLQGRGPPGPPSPLLCTRPCRPAPPAAGHRSSPGPHLQCRKQLRVPKPPATVSWQVCSPVAQARNLGVALMPAQRGQSPLDPP